MLGPVQGQLKFSNQHALTSWLDLFVSPEIVSFFDGLINNKNRSNSVVLIRNLILKHSDL